MLTQEERNIIEEAKAKKELERAQGELKEAEDYLKPKSFTKETLGKTLFTPSKKVSPKKKARIFGTKAVAPSYTQEQNILRGMFGHGPTVIMPSPDGRSLPKIHSTLTSGGGLLKSGDKNRETAAIFNSRRSLPFFGGQRRR